MLPLKTRRKYFFTSFFLEAATGRAMISRMRSFHLHRLWLCVITCLSLQSAASNSGKCCIVSFGSSARCFVVARWISSPFVFNPNTSSIWQVGNRYLIEWNPGFRLPGGLFFNNFTRLTVKLFRRRPVRGDEELLTIVQDYPMMLGQLVWEIPSTARLQNSKTEKHLGIDRKTVRPPYYILAYPSYFDWPGGCDNCWRRIPRSDLFHIRSASCQGECAAGVQPSVPESQILVKGDPSLWNPYQPPHLSPYGPGIAPSIDPELAKAVRSVGIAIGIVAFVIFGIALFVYARRGRKRNWKRTVRPYRRQTPPSTDDSAQRKDIGPSPLRYVVEKDDTESHSHQEDDDEDDLSTLGSKRDSIVLPQHSAMPTLTIPVHSGSAASSRASSPMMHPSSRAGSAGFRGYTTPKVLSGRGTASSSTQRPSTATTRSTTPEESSMTLPPRSSASTPINQTDAILVGNTFRNALRVATPVLVAAEAMQSPVDEEQSPVVPALAQGPLVQSSPSMSSDSPVLASLAYDDPHVSISEYPSNQPASKKQAGSDKAQ
jgi:hypothetical protein